MGIILIQDDYSISFVLAPPEPLPDWWEGTKVIEGMPDNYYAALDVYDPSGTLRGYVETFGGGHGYELIKARVKDIETDSGTANVDAVVKAKEVSDKFAASIAAGYDTGLGFRIKIDTEAKNEFAALMTSINTQLIVGTPIENVVIPPIFGINEDSPDGLDDGHQLTAAEFIAVFSAGAAHYGGLIVKRKQYSAMINDGVTDFAVDFSQS